ncbi:MAG: hypothetical protein Q8O40_08025, partial [Chloroflexota bacterium]|nr:hypothetical protein [Chloroflexota bacterium]
MAADMGALLSLMEGGRLVRAKVGRRLDEQVELWVVAATNSLTHMALELISRFAMRHLHPYTRTEFWEVVTGVLAHREGLAPPLAEEIAAAVDGVTQDVRDAVRVARLASQVSGKRALDLLGLTGAEMMVRVVRTYTYTTPNHPRGTVTRVLVLRCGHEQRR